MARWPLAIEGLIKGKLFGCQQCGQCLLGRTQSICPMTCPKGLRNGPCGGTLEGMCEVYPERPCVWVRIREGQLKGRDAVSVSLPTFGPVDESLFNTSSWWNHLTGADRQGRSSLERPEERREHPRTESRFEARLLSGEFVITAEIRSPGSEDGLARVRGEIDVLNGLVDAVNTTSDHGGMRTIDSLLVAQEALARDCDAIVHICGRDFTPESYDARLRELSAAGIRNVLCLTGDWRGGPRNEVMNREEFQQNFFRMESAQMMHEASRLGDEGSDDSDSQNCPTESLFVGGAINPNSSPADAVYARLAQKMDCGVEFIQTQVICEAEPFHAWLGGLEERGLRRRASILAGVPVIGSRGALEFLQKLAGVRMPQAIYERLQGSSDFDAACREFTRNLVDELLETSAVDGLHLMSFGASVESVAEEIARVRSRLNRGDGAGSELLETDSRSG